MKGGKGAREGGGEGGAGAASWAEAGCSRHVNEGWERALDGGDQAVKASLVLTLSSAAGFTLHSQEIPSARSAAATMTCEHWSCTTLRQQRRNRGLEFPTRLWANGRTVRGCQDGLGDSIRRRQSGDLIGPHG